MVIVAGHIVADPHRRERYLADCEGVAELARRAPGCLDFAIGADLVDARPRQHLRTLGVAGGRRGVPRQRPRRHPAGRHTRRLGDRVRRRGPALADLSCQPVLSRPRSVPRRPSGYR
ncbi:putative quinol monooxygenase [Nonomuraea ferruginea]